MHSNNMGMSRRLFLRSLETVRVLLTPHNSLNF